MVQNRALVYSGVPHGMPVPGKDLTISTTDFDLDAPAPLGGITLQNCYISFDPFQRGKMRDPSNPSYNAAYALNAPIHNIGIAKVLKSDNPDFKAGDIVRGECNIEEYSAFTKEYLDSLGWFPKFHKLENPLGLDWMVYLGALGMSGLTAWSSFYAIGKPKAGETIWVSAASGAVGQIVGQLAKHEGLKVIGSVGNDAKLKYVIDDLGFDGAFNYKNEDPRLALQRLAPKGIDIFYDNVGGEQLDVALEMLNDWARVVSCGSVSQTSLPPDQLYRLKNAPIIVRKRLTIRGFIVYDPDMGPIFTAEHQKKLSQWIKDGTFKVKISVTEGIQEAAGGLVGMLKGENFGKACVRIRDLY